MKKIILIIICIFLATTISSASNNSKDKYYYRQNKPTSQMTSKEIKQRDILFKACVNSGENRAKCYAMYY